MEQQAHSFDVIVIGAGLSGISAGYHLQKHCADKSFTILEGRDAVGGTWDLFRYPGIRSDSDMFTLGYSFRPWLGAKAIADGEAIRDYVQEAADDYGLNEKIHFGRRVTSLEWSSAQGLWTLHVETDGEKEIYQTPFVISCAGYYRYAAGYTPDLPGLAAFKGDVIHPQCWPESYDYKDKRVVIIGSGATAVTLAPAMAAKAGHVTMLQRSPTYYISQPAVSALAKFLSRFLPSSVSHWLMRWQRVLMQQALFKIARARPKKAAANLIKMAQERLPEGYDVKTHFTPRYNPWEQRLCLIPDDDLFNAISEGDVSIVTDTIREIDGDGIGLDSGNHIDADLIVTATGLSVQVFGGAELIVDGAKVQPSERLTYKGAMIEGVPNLLNIFGYTNASWTLRADLVNEFACRLMKYLDKEGYVSATPINEDADMAHEPFLDFSSGYVKRAEAILPKQGAQAPWRHPQAYFRDMMSFRHGRIDDGVLRFEKHSSKEEIAADALALRPARAS